MTKIWHENFKNYMNFIVKHQNYHGMPIEYKQDNSIKWIANKKSKSGLKRVEWIDKQAKKLNIERNAGYYAKVMYMIHPTKEKPCQICGESMSLSYIYPNHHLKKYLAKHYGIVPDVFDDIFIIYEKLDKLGIDMNNFIIYLIGKVKLDTSVISNNNHKSILTMIENHCRNNGNKLLGPGAMSNFPDRLDGFHTYNRCCRSKEDTGRSKENLRTYSKDRRAYEYWSDGNIHAANKFMKHEYFIGSTADHIGPISLGFKHDPLFLTKMDSRSNSSKNNRLSIGDIKKLISIEKNSGIVPASIYSSIIWKNLKDDFENNPNFQLKEWQEKLDLNTKAYMKLLYSILLFPDNIGEKFLIEKIIRPKMEYFKYDYLFDNDGNIINKTPRKVNESNKKEFERFIKVSIKSLHDFEEKTNRKRKISLSKNIIKDLINFSNTLILDNDNQHLSDFYLLVENLQLSILKEETK
ncbi:hypothetical protein KFV05_08915 [Macrococcoides canis]|uniref:hypothetical protein n=1 Tax=Macrococcoides canis TaxID=1855823 RepID=UPI0020B8EFBE|nr:hypothetical protein [Macrococcus canis]UTH01831.1 hypothetical protein KFV05_08915 [Macrococcus canis]